MAFQSEITVAFNDIDAAGIVYFGTVFDYCHRTLEELLKTIKIPLPQILQTESWAMPLVHAAAAGHAGIAHNLLLARADVNAVAVDTATKPATRTTALLEAAHHGRVRVFQVLVDHGANVTQHVDHYGQNALHLASGAGHGEIVEACLVAGVPVDSLDKRMRTALHGAARGGHLHLLKGLRLNRANLTFCFFVPT